MSLIIIEQIFFFLVILMPIVFVHELGHYYAAKKVGVKVEIFSIGFGKELFSWQDKSGTKWGIAPIPLGGYVKMQGDTNSSSVKTNNHKPVRGDLLYVNVLARIFIFISGPLANFASGILIFSFIFFINGKQIVSNEIGEIIPNSSAERANLLPGDIIKTVDKKVINNFNELRYIILENPGRKLNFEIERNNKQFFLDVTPSSIYIKEKNIYIGQIGIKSLKSSYKKVGISESLLLGTNECLRIIKESIKYLTVKFNIYNFGSPIQIAEFSSEIAKLGIISFLYGTAYISIAIGFLNLLPILPLDGGHILFGLIEYIRGKPVSIFYQNIILKLGVSLLFGFMIVIFAKDIWLKLY